MFDFCVIGGGIVGLATAHAVARRQPGASILVLEKEATLASHQTGHNSGVIHAGVYYAPGSLKARLCREGELATKVFCDEHGIEYRTTGKLIVATNEVEEQRLHALEANAKQNGLVIRRIGGAEISELEPNVVGRSALLVDASAIVNYRKVVQAIADDLSQQGGEVRLNTQVERIEEKGDSVRVHAQGGQYWDAARVIVCSGLQADRMVERAHESANFQIVPFRGEYYSIRPEKRELVSRMIYPVPDPALPFLGIHLTPMIDGGLTVGPNAVLGFSREQYKKFGFDAADVARYLTYPGFWKVIGANLKSGLMEMKDSLFKSSYLEKCQKYCPSLELEDLLPYTAGIRAQAVSRDGKLIHDFAFHQTARVLHVCNAPSPAATSAFPIGEMVAHRMIG